MAIEEGLFQGQDQIEADLHNARGWTLNEQKPDFWDGLGLSVPKGLGQGVANSVQLLARGLRTNESDLFKPDPLAAGAVTDTAVKQVPPWQKDFNADLDHLQAQAHEGAKSLTPDPTVTGTGANLVQGFTRSVGEFTGGSLVGGPFGGAAALGLTEGYARFLDLKDQGVDDATATKSAYLTGIANGAGALMPMSLPAKFAAALPIPTLLTQAGAGAVINTAFGAVNRAGDAAILRHAGYPEMADQMEPWDKAQLATDAITGLFFGAHAGLHNVDPSVRDAAKVVQDRQEVINRAVGVPVDMKSAAVHRQALESALGDLLSGKSVDLNGDSMDGATFARPGQEPDLATRIIREEFEKANVLADAKEFDDWLKGEPVPRETEKTVGENTGDVLTPENVAARREDAEARLKEAGPEPSPEERQAMIDAETERLKTPESVAERLKEQYGENMDKVVQERAEAPLKAADEQRKQATSDLEKVSADEELMKRSQDPAAAAIEDRPQMELSLNGEKVKAKQALEAAKAESEQANAEAELAFQTAADCGARFA